jgi:uncharacterized protein (DUF1015 family)
VPRFEPFRGLRYRGDVDLDAVTAPPYDVISPRERAELAARTAYNVVHVDLPDEAEGPGRYRAAEERLARWEAEGVLVRDAEPAFYVYRMGYRDRGGRPRQTTGVLGALGLVPPFDGVLPHERTTPKAKTDRLELLRATAANLSPIWGLSLAEGLADLCEPAGGPPAGRATDADGVHHRLWPVTSAALKEAITERVSSAPVVIADGHHRWETSIAYRDEHGSRPGPADLTLALVVELAPDQLDVRPIHRLLRGLPGDLDLRDALSPWFEVLDTQPPDSSLSARAEEADALGLALPGGRAALLRPRPDAFPDETPDLDASRLDVARAGLPEHELVYEAEIDAVLAEVDAGAAAGVVLRPASVAQIAATAHGGERMPPKTTYFWPKPRTGFVFRPLD